MSLTKQDIIAIANKYFGDNYLCFNSKMGFPKSEKLSKPKTSFDHNAFNIFSIFITFFNEIIW